MFTRRLFPVEQTAPQSCEVHLSTVVCMCASDIIHVTSYHITPRHIACTYTGLDCHGLIGTSFAAFLKRELNERIDFWHCLPHQFNLGLNESLDACDALKLYFIPHLRMCHAEFKRSSKNRGVFKTLHSELKEMDKSYSWEIFFPKLFSLTRWIGY